MPLTRGDKVIIGSAVALAAVIVLGLAALKRPALFSDEETPRPEFVEPAPAAMQPGPSPSAKPVTSPVEAPVAAPAAPAPAPAKTPPTPPPAAPETAAPAPAPAVSGSAAAPAVVGDETLDKMFAEITKEGQGTAKADEPKPAGEEPGPAKTAPDPAPAVEAKDAGPAPAPVEKAAAAAEEKKAAEPKASAPAKPAAAAKKKKSVAAAAVKVAKTTKPAAKAKAVAGRVIRLVAVEKAGEFVLTVQTSRPPVHFQKLFIADPPRMVLDLSGNWAYFGALTKVTGEPFVRRIRVGKHREMFRVVLDMGPDALSQLRGTPTVERVPGGVALKIPK